METQYIHLCNGRFYKLLEKKKKGIISPANTLDFLLEGLIVVVSQWFSWMERKMEKAVC